MKAAVEDILAQCRPKIKALLRTRSHYDVSTLIQQFKTHIWGIIENRIGAIFHAASSHLQRLDSMQRGFLQELGLDESTAFTEYNFAPPCLRRDIAMLGFFHKRVLGQAHPAIDKLLPLHSDLFTFAAPGHTKQIHNQCEHIRFQHALYKRSIFGHIEIYNALPQHAVDITDVASFQAFLTQVAKTKCQQHKLFGQHCFNSRQYVATLD